MWYLAELLFAEPRRPACGEYLCERSNVVLLAEDALAAHARAQVLGQSRAAEPGVTMSFVGVTHLTTIGHELRDGTEVVGEFVRERDVWDRVPEFVPEPLELKAIAWEANQDRPLNGLLTEEQISAIKRVLGDDA